MLSVFQPFPGYGHPTTRLAPGALNVARTDYARRVLNTLYQDAEVYDILHAPGTAKDVAGLARIERLYSKAPTSGSWLEPACGSARYLLAAAAKGRRVIGFDLAPGMIEYAKSRFKAKGGGGLTRKANLFVADMADFASHVKPGSVSLAFNLINSIRHLDTDLALDAHFRDIAASLHKGGVYAVGISLSEYGLEPPSEDVWQGKRGGVHVHQVVQFEPPTVRGRSKAARVERVFSHLTITRGRGSKQVVTTAAATYALRCYDLEQWRAAIDRSPLRELATSDERGTPLPPACPGYTLFILARKDHPTPLPVPFRVPMKPDPATRG